MEITSAYVLGMLTIVAVAVVTVIVVGIVKILKLNTQINNIYSQLNDAERHIHDRISDDRRRMEQVIIDIHRDIDMVDKTLQNKMENELKGVHTNTKRYIDSRIDKLIDGYFDHVGAKTPPKNNKDLING
jgi:predicted PurR-regulated permease PerM